METRSRATPPGRGPGAGEQGAGSPAGALPSWGRDEQFRGVVEASKDLMTVVDEHACLLYVNPAGERFFGIPPEECIGLNAFEFIHPDDRAATEKAFQVWIRGSPSTSFSFENRQVSRTGETRHVLWTITRQPLSGGQRVVLASIARDITELRRTQRELLRSEIRHKSVLAGMLDPVVTIDPHGTIQDASDSVRSVFGYDPGELIGQNVSVLMPEPHRSKHDGYLERYRETGETAILNRTREFEVLRKDRRRIICELSVSRIDVPGRQEPLYCGSFRDVTARKAAERALAESERRFHAIFDQEFQFVGLLDPGGTMLEVNQTALDLSGLEREAVLGRPFWDTPWWSHSEEARVRVEQAIRDAAAGRFVRFEIDTRSRRGETRTIDFSLKPIEDDDGEVVLLIPEGRDITRIKRAQQRETTMMRAFATIGESASILAHEIKNPITAVHTALRAVADKLGEDEQAVLQDLVQRMQKLEHLMHRTLSLARPLDLHARSADPRELLDEAVGLMDALEKEPGVEFEIRVAEGCPSLDVDRQLIEEVLVNLIRNALDAFEGSGRIRLEAAPDDEGCVIVCVDDDGPGIPESLRDSLFKPFVTSRASGNGLGLAIAKKVVEAHGGTIEADRSPLGGARFVLRLPAG